LHFCDNLEKKDQRNYVQTIKRATVEVSQHACGFSFTYML